MNKSQNWLIQTLLYSQHFPNYDYYLVLCVTALKLSLRTGYTLDTLTEQTDTSSHNRLFVDGRLAGSSCLVGCAGVGPPRTSWQPCLRQPCARLLSSGMILVEQKHHSTQSLDPRPGAICKTLQSNTRASYDPQQGGWEGGRRQRRNPTRLARIGGEIKLSHSVQMWRWHKRGTGEKFIDHEIVIRRTVARRDCSYSSSKITRIQFIYWQRALAERILTVLQTVRGSQCIQNMQTNKETFSCYTKQISIQKHS